MGQEISETDLAVWDRLLQTSLARSDALAAFFAQGVDRVALIKRGLHASRSSPRASTGSR